MQSRLANSMHRDAARPTASQRLATESKQRARDKARATSNSVAQATSSKRARISHSPAIATRFRFFVCIFGSNRVQFSSSGRMIKRQTSCNGFARPLAVFASAPTSCKVDSDPYEKMATIIMSTGRRINHRQRARERAKRLLNSLLWLLPGPRITLELSLAR